MDNMDQRLSISFNKAIKIIKKYNKTNYNTKLIHVTVLILIALNKDFVDAYKEV